MSHKSKIESWFEITWGGSLMLPDGWYGRPYDGQLMLTSIEEENSEIKMVLDEVLRFHFFAVEWVSNSGDLIIGPFETLIFDAEPFGGGPVSRKIYGRGEVKLIVAPG